MMQLELLRQCTLDSETKKTVTKCLIGTTAIMSSIYFLRQLFKRYKNDKKIDRKRKEVNEKKLRLFQKLQGMASPFENIKKICHLSGTEISTKIRSGEVSAVDVLEAYQANALMKDADLNFIADIVYDADVSSLLLRGNEENRLNGWPLSIKDTFHIEKYDCTQGLFTKILQPCSNTSVFIRALKEEGAIPFIITNVCQGLQKMESSNPIFGRTLNPFNHNMTCGGSSAGEGASLGSESSLIGVGNDLGGSIRIPASYCGIYGLKPTSSRVSARHTDRIYTCDLLINISIGPMARYIDDLILTFKAMTSDRVFEMDSYNPPVPFNETLLLSKIGLKIGFYTHIGGSQVRPIPAVERAVMIAKEALERAGHQLVEFNLPNVDEICEIICKAFLVDAGERLIKHGLKKGPIDPSLRCTVRIWKRSRCVKHVLACICRIFSRQLSQSILASCGSTVSETWDLKDRIMSYRDVVLTMLEKENIDGIICPVLPIVATTLNNSETLESTDIYCSVYNVLDYPAGSVPVTRVSDDDITKLKTSYTDRTVRRLQQESLGLPVGVQCVSRPWREEICLRMMKEVSLHL